jgi:HEPN domain-containing protein
MSSWGPFVYRADSDLISFAWLHSGGLRVSGYYHATQAIEKYLKALALSVIDPDGAKKAALSKRSWLREHDLFEIARQCAPQFPYYVQPEVTVKLERFSEFDKVARYPGIKQVHGNGFTSEDIPVIWDLIRRLRTDIPIPCDDYPLGMFVRGHHQGHPEFKVYSHVIAERAGCLAAFRRMFPDVDNIVRW